MPILMTSTAYILGANYYLYIPQHLLLLVYITVGHLQTTFLLLVYHVMAYFLHIVTATCALHSYCLIYALYMVLVTCTLGNYCPICTWHILLVTYLAGQDIPQSNPKLYCHYSLKLFQNISMQKYKKKREKQRVCSTLTNVALLFNY